MKSLTKISFVFCLIALGCLVLYAPDCPITEAGKCDDGKDNDRDEKTDCADTEDCGTEDYCKEAGNCTDTKDNDVDGKTDCDDSDCFDDPACFEGNCTDGVDNDGDGDTDCDDTDCGSDPACFESNCTDGLDNDDAEQYEIQNQIREGI